MSKVIEYYKPARNLESMQKVQQKD